MAPKANEKKHGHEHELPRKIEKKKVESEKDGQGACEGPGKAEKKKPFLSLYSFPGGEEDSAAQERGEADQDQADAVGRQVKTDAQPGEPGRIEFREPRAREHGAIGQARDRPREEID